MEKINFEPVRSEQIVSVPGYCVWCGSMARTPDGKCHLFISMWESKYGFEMGWIMHSKIGYAIADEPGGKYEFQGIIFEGSGKENGWDRDSVHNPYVVYHEGMFYLYYSGNYGDGVYSTHGKNQKIGIACAADPMGPWTRYDEPLFPARVGQGDETMTSNPSVCQMSDGRFIMVYKGSSQQPPYNGKVSHFVAFSEHPTGPWTRMEQPIFDVDGAKFPAEDPCVYKKGEKLYCMLHDNANYYVSDKFRTLIQFESTDGLEWKPAEPFYICSREIEFEEEGKKLHFRVERPFMYLENDEPKVLFLATLPRRTEAYSCNIHMNIIQK